MIVLFLLFLFNFQLSAQLPGYINRPATSAGGRAILDPNGDGYTSLTTSGFGNNDVTNSELVYTGIKAYSIEPYGDLRRGPNHNYSDFVPDDAGNGVYHHFSAAQNVLFRMRMGSVMPGSKGYSIMMDTDGKFGATGPNADPNYLPTTTGTNGNPGFEIEIVLESNFRIAIYNVDGTSSPVLVKQYLNWQDMSQISIAASNDNGDPDFLIDFYIPFSDLQAAPFNLTTASTIRMSATTVMAPKAAIGGPRSDIYGTGGDTYEDFIDGQPSCPIFVTSGSCTTAMCTAAPTVNSPVSTGVVSINGTWTKSTLTGAASSATIIVYKNGTVVDSVTGVTSGSSWNLPGVTTINNDIITAKARANDESICLVSNSIIASSCNSSTRPVTPTGFCGDRKGFSGTNYPAGTTIYLYRLTSAGRTLIASGIPPANGFAINGAGWTLSGGCSAGGGSFVGGTYEVVFNNGTCDSKSAFACAINATAGWSTTATTAPVINNSTSIYTSTTSIAGTAVTGSTIRIYIDDVLEASPALSGTNWNYTFTKQLITGQVITVTAQLPDDNTGKIYYCVGSATATVTCFTSPPIITADNNNQLTGGAPITGKSVDAPGTTIRVYTSINTLVATTTVEANGTWSTGNAGTLPTVYNAVAGTTYYANAQNGSCGVSTNSASYTAAGPTSAARCGTITGPITPGVASISGTLTGSFSTTTVNLYLDDELIGSAVTSGTSWGPITVNSTPSNTLYSNGILKIGVQENGKQEVACPGSAIAITCTPTPVAPVFTPVTTTINTGQTVTYDISNAVSGTFYAIADSSTGQSRGQGTWASANGTLLITTSAFTTAGTYKVKLRSTSLSGVTVCSNTSTIGTVTVNNITLPLSLYYFRGKKESGNILLNWATISEVNVNRFEIEQSHTGSAFIKIGEVPATGFSNTLRTYEFIDKKVTGYINYYRLKMIDRDGKFSYSHVLAFSGTTDNINFINIRPNPFINSFTLSIDVSQAQLLTIHLSDMAGKILYTNHIKASAGKNDIKVNGLANLSSGMYIIKLISSEGMLHEKILKVK